MGISTKVGLFSQDINLSLSSGEYIIEKITIPALKRKNINLMVAPGTVAIINKQTFKGQGVAYKINDVTMGGGKGAELTAYLYPDKMFDNVPITFFGGQHSVKLSVAVSGFARAKFSIVGDAVVELSDYKDLALYFDRTVTKKDVIDEINKNSRVHLTNEVSAVASSYITADTTEIELRGKLNAIASDVINNRKVSAVLMNMGLMVSQRGLSLRLNLLDETEEMVRVLQEALLKAEINELGKDEQERADRERQAQRDHEVALIIAQNTTRTEGDHTNTINGNSTTPVTINQPAPQAQPQPAPQAQPQPTAQPQAQPVAQPQPAPQAQPQPTGSGAKFCRECGTPVKPGAKHCNECGAKV